MTYNVFSGTLNPTHSLTHVRHMMTLVHFDEAVIRLMQFSLVIFCCNITFFVFWFSQGSVATLIRRGGWSLYCHMCRSFLNLSVKTALKSVDFWQLRLLFTAHGCSCSYSCSWPPVEWLVGRHFPPKTLHILGLEYVTSFFPVPHC